MPFLDTTKRVWKVGKLEIPVIEDVPMEHMMWFDTKMREVKKKESDGKLTETDALKFDEEWWVKVAEIGLGLTKDEVIKSGISKPDFKILMAEVYNFLENIGTVERAKQSAFYAAKTQKKENKE